MREFIHSVARAICTAGACLLAITLIAGYFEWWSWEELTMPIQAIIGGWFLSLLIMMASHDRRATR